jgi:glycosyltransferase involved in cell wall biosynthesis
MRITVITVVKDNMIGLKKTIESIRSQDYKNIEHIIVDGLSTDGTLDVISEMRDENTRVISERDSGIYDAINKGIKISTGKVIGVLHSGDIYASKNILSRVAEKFLTKNLEAVFADVEYVDNFGAIRREYSSKYFSKINLKYGIIMAHTSLFLSKELYIKFGTYNKNYKIAGDFELISKIFSNDIIFEYDEIVYIKMILGGISNKSLWNRYIINIEILHALKSNNIQSNLFKLMYRYLLKINEFKFFR